MKVDNLDLNNFKGDSYLCRTGITFMISLIVLVVDESVCCIFQVTCQ